MISFLLVGEPRPLSVACRELSQKTKQLEQAVFQWLRFLLELGSSGHQLSLKETIFRPPMMLM